MAVSIPPPTHVADDGRVRIRPYRADDVDPLFEAIDASRAELSRWLPWCTESYGLVEVRSWVESRPEAWERGDELSFVVEEVATGRLLGANGIHGVGGAHPVGAIGYWMRSDATGRGHTSAAVRLLAAFGFDVCGLQRLEILAAVDNVASRRVAEKVGATLEGILRARLFLGGAPRDAACYSLLPDDPLC